MILKLKDGGAAVRFLVQGITDDVSRKPGAKAQYKFAGRTTTDTDATVWVFAETAERQFKRIGLDRQSVVGKWLEFSKTATGYLDITLPADTPAPVAPPAAAPPAPAPKPNAKQPFSAGPTLPGEPGYVAPPQNGAATLDRKSAFQHECRVYEACVDHVLKVTVPKLWDLNVQKVEITHDGVAAMAGQLFARVRELGLDV